MKYFTKAQIDEIRARLATLSVRDTDFITAEDIQSDDCVAIVQGGVNKKLSVDEFRDALQNGPKGDPGEPGADGEDGRGIVSVTTQETVDHNILVVFNYTDNTASSITLPGGLDYDDLERLTESEIETLLDF